jgi:hypothetical protein
MLEIAAIKSSLLSSLMTGLMTTVSPNYAQLDSYVIASEKCSNICMKVDVKSDALQDPEPSDLNYK